MSVEKIYKRRFGVGTIVKWSVTAVVLIVALVVAGRWLAWRMAHVVTDAGFVKAHVVEVAPEVPAKVLKVLVKEGDLVQAGQPLVELDDTDYGQREQMAAADVRTLAAQKDVAAAKLALASGDVPAQIHAAEAAVAAARQQRAQAAANVTYLAAQHRRLSALLEQKAIGRAKFDEIDAAYKAARAASEAAEAQIRAAEAKLAEA
ncbi:MAG: biotin/lipoyl-binding protein, partial [Candidatus Polarisedimenticolia bacterium]